MLCDLKLHFCSFSKSFQAFLEFYSSFLPCGLSKPTTNFHVIVPCVVLREIFAKYISTNTAFLESGFQSKSIPFQIQNLTDSNHNKKKQFSTLQMDFLKLLASCKYLLYSRNSARRVHKITKPFNIYLQIFFVLLFTKTDTSLLKVYSSQETFS